MFYALCLKHKDAYLTICDVLDPKAAKQIMTAYGQQFQAVDVLLMIQSTPTKVEYYDMCTRGFFDDCFKMLEFSEDEFFEVVRR